MPSNASGNSGNPGWWVYTVARGEGIAPKRHGRIPHAVAASSSESKAPNGSNPNFSVYCAFDGEGCGNVERDAMLRIRLAFA